MTTIEKRMKQKDALKMIKDYAMPISDLHDRGTKPNFWEVVGLMAVTGVLAMIFAWAIFGFLL